MSLFEQISGMLGGAQQVRDQLQRYQQGQASFDDPQSPDVQNLNEMMRSVPADVQQDVFARAAQQVDPTQYREHVTPGVGGTDPLGFLDRGQLATLAGALLNAYASRQGGSAGAGGSGPAGGAGGMGGWGGPRATGAAGAAGASGGLGELLQKIPGLQTTNPSQMDPNQVAILADWLRQNHPEAFGQAASQVAQQQPSLLQQLLGNKTLLLAAATLGAKILSDRARARSG